MSPGLLTVRDVARQLNVSTATVYKLVSSGQLAHVRISNAIRVDQEDLGTFFLRGRRPRVKHGPSDS